jgi:Ca2+-binding EF-hand superfamily protein
MEVRIKSKIQRPGEASPGKMGSSRTLSRSPTGSAHRLSPSSSTHKLKPGMSRLAQTGGSTASFGASTSRIKQKVVPDESPPTPSGGMQSQPSSREMRVKSQQSGVVNEVRRRKSSHEIKAQLQGTKTKKRPHPLILLCKRIFGRRQKVDLSFEAQKLVEKCGLTPKHMHDLKVVFDAIDIDGSGSIDCQELLAFIDIPDGPFSRFIFQFAGVDPRGTIDFDGTVLIVLNYCWFSRDDILRFCFQQFDTDGSGAIDEQEFVELVRVVNNAAPMFPGNYASALDQFDANQDGLLDFEEFREIDKRFPLILFPAYRLQDAMQKCCLGQAEWTKLRAAYRRKLVIEEYSLLHGGAEPDKKTIKALLAQQRYVK